MSIERDESEKTDFDEIIDEFGSVKVNVLHFERNCCFMPVVATCCVIFCKTYKLVSHYYAQTMMTLPSECFYILKNKYRIMLCSLWNKLYFVC